MARYNKALITKELCERDMLLFQPATWPESQATQEALFAMGYQWADGSTKTLTYSEILETGIVLYNRVIYTRDITDPRDYLHCTLEQFSKAVLHQDTEIYQFNKISARMDVLEEKMDRLIALIETKQIKKKIDMSGDL